MRTRGFTLFEVLMALLIASGVTVVVMVLIGAGARAQAKARFQLYASAKAVELVDVFSTFHTCDPATDGEAPNPWDVSISYSNRSFDIEHRVASYRTGLCPLPDVIAARLDSDRDEIARLLAEGGRLYYSQPRAAANYKAVVNNQDGVELDLPPPSETQKLVWGVVGYAQANVIPVLPWKAWPYTTAYPSPPMFFQRIIGAVQDAGDGVLMHNERKFATGEDVYWFPFRPWGALPLPAGHPQIVPGGGEGNGEDHVLLEDVISGDPDIRNVYQTTTGPDDGSGTGPKRWGYLDYRCLRLADVEIRRRAALRYVRAALWYCAAKGIQPQHYDSGPVDACLTSGSQRAAEIRALRYLAHAAACLTVFKRVDPAASLPWDLATGILLPETTLPAPAGGTVATAPGYTITEAKIRWLHENSLRLAMRFCAEHPYDWSVPRPTNRAIMMDHPLLEWDLFSGTVDPLTGALTAGGVPAVDLRSGTGGALRTSYLYNATPRFGGAKPAAWPALPVPGQWRPISASRIENIGRSLAYAKIRIPSEGDADSIWGDRARFSLTRPFHPSERCRQLVCWAVDWVSYEDAETAPSAAVDASRYPKWAPHLNAFFGTNGHSYESLIAYQWRWQDWHQFTFRNPELPMLFKRDVNNSEHLLAADRQWLDTGASVRTLVHGPDNLGGRQVDQVDRFASADDQRRTRAMFLGLYGADRNYNGVLDRGPRKRSERLRAVEIARFNLYDPRLVATLR